MLHENMEKFADCHIHIRGQRKNEIQSMLDDVADMGVTDACLLSLPSNHSSSENLAALYWKLKYKKMQIRSFGGLHHSDMYAEIPYEKQAQRFLELGGDGVKLLDMKPDSRNFNKRGINHPAYDKMFSFLEETGTPILIHANDPKEMWEKPDPILVNGLSIYRGMVRDKGYLSYDEIYDETFEMLDKHPHLNVVFAHVLFLSSDLQKAIYVMEKYPNIKMDLAPGTDMYFHFMDNLPGWHDFFTKYSNRILFGTDTNTYKDFNKEIHELVYTFLTHDDTEFRMPCYGNWTIRGLGLDAKTVENICYNSYASFVSPEIQPVNEGEFYHCAEQMLIQLNNNSCDPYRKKAFEFWSDSDMKDDDLLQTDARSFLKDILAEKGLLHMN